MDHLGLYHLRETYNRDHILLCFNGPFSQGLIEEIGNALKHYMESEAASGSSSRDVFAIYIEIAQNIQHYGALRGYSDNDASATVVIARDSERHFIISAGNIVEPDDGEELEKRVNELAQLDKDQLKAAYKAQLRQPRDADNSQNAGLGLIDMARKASAPISCSLYPINNASQKFFSLRVVI